MTRKACCLVIVGGLIAFGAAGASAAALPDLSLKGPYEVGFTMLTPIDAARDGRLVPIYLWYPVDPATITGSTPRAMYPLDPFNEPPTLPVVSSAEFEAEGLDRAYQQPEPAAGGNFPLVVFSPGWANVGYDLIYLGTRLASHGIVLAVVSHWGCGTVPGEPFEHLALALLKRPRDMSFALDTLLALNAESAGPLSGLVDASKVAASGHSLGGYAAMTLAGGDDLVSDLGADFRGWPAPLETEVPTPPDPRFTAIVTLDGSNQCLHFYELARITVPAMAIGEEWDFLGGDPWQARQHAAITATPSYRVDVAMAEHVSFVNVCASAAVWANHGLDPSSTEARIWVQGVCDGSTVIEPAEAQRLTTKYMLAFLKTELLEETGYKPILTPGYAITREPGVEFFVTEKRNPDAVTEDFPGDYLYFPHQPGKSQAKAQKDPWETLFVVPGAAYRK